MMQTNDPYGDIKIYHKAHLFGPKGEVSPLCANPPKAMKLGKNTWTLRDEAVTCRKCKKMIKESTPGAAPTMKEVQ